MSKKRERRDAARMREAGAVSGTAAPEQVSPAAPHTSPSHPHADAPAHHVGHHTDYSGFVGKIKYVYETHYRILLVIALLIVGLAALQVVVQTATTGDFIHKGVSLKGGITVTIPEYSGDPLAVEESLKQRFPNYDIGVRALAEAGIQNGLVIDAEIIDPGDIDRFVGAIEGELGVVKGGYSVEVIGSSLGESFFRETLIALIAAFVCMGIVIFITFRTLAPSAMVILAAASDIIISIALTNLTGIKVSTAGIAAFLMLVGYSVDTDILLTTRVLKRKSGTAMEAVYSSIKTGSLMTFTTIAAATVGLVFSQSEVLKQIMLIILFGLFGDLFTTWIVNVTILRMYLEKKGKWHTEVAEHA